MKKVRSLAETEDEKVEVGYLRRDEIERKSCFRDRRNRLITEKSRLLAALQTYLKFVLMNLKN